MASVKELKNGKVKVTYDIPDGNGRHQTSKTFETLEDANEFVLKLELKKLKKQIIATPNLTVSAFLKQWLEISATQLWSAKTYDSNESLFRRHIFPYFENLPLKQLQPIFIEKSRADLCRKEVTLFGKNKTCSLEGNPYLSTKTVDYIIKLLKQALQVAVSWHLIDENPVKVQTNHKAVNSSEKVVWDIKDMTIALKNIKHPMLHLYIHLAIICSLRPGEVVGLKWDCIDFEKQTITIRRTLERVSIDSLEKSLVNTQYKAFYTKSKKSVLILKEFPKNDSSIRSIYITNELKEELIKRKQQIEIDKESFDGVYTDNNLVFSLDDGRPVNTELAQRWLKRWFAKTDVEIPQIQCRLLRHSSATSKMEISHGDVKSVQGDTGHSDPKVLMDAYLKTNFDKRKSISQQLSNQLFDENQTALEEKNLLELLKKKDIKLYNEVIKLL